MRSAPTATRLIAITNLHNPSGALTGEEDLRQIGALRTVRGQGPGRRGLSRQRRPGPAQPPRCSAPQFVATNSLTKVYGLSGLRCGWILAEPGSPSGCGA